MTGILDELMQQKEKIKILEALTEVVRLHTLYGIKRKSGIEEAEILKLLERLINKKIVAKISDQGETFYYITFEGREILDNIKGVINILK